MERHVNISFSALTGKELQVKVIDVGANPIGDSPPYAAMLLAGEADIIGFEPNADGLSALEKAKGPNETYLPLVIGDGARHTLHVCQAPGMTSLLQPNPAVLRLFHGFPGWGEVKASVAVETVRLDDVQAAAGADLIKLDVQGAELLVLQHAEAILAQALVIHSEVEFLQMYQDQPLFSDIESFLRQRGFMFHRFYPLTCRMIQPMPVNHDVYAGLSQLLWGDAIFVRDITRLESLSDRGLLAMAKIMHDCYRSDDLVLHVLMEYDRRTGEQLGPAYATALNHKSQA
jgi:FkbM family methyltransferase